MVGQLRQSAVVVMDGLATQKWHRRFGHLRKATEVVGKAESHPHRLFNYIRRKPFRIEMIPDAVSGKL